MGTRSLLAVETKPGNYHVQYMQFDGYPSCKGHEYYAAIIKTLQQTGDYFMTKSGLPNKKLRDRILTYLDEIQYQSGHSIGNSYEIKVAEWVKQDCWQEWQYLFKKNGDFEFFSTYENGNKCVIPWEFTRGITNCFGGELFPFGEDGISILTPFFDGNWTGWDAEEDEKKTFAPSLKIAMGEVLAFPDQKDNGWRGFGSIFLREKGKKDTILCESMFAKGEKGSHVRKLKMIETKLMKSKFAKEKNED